MRNLDFIISKQFLFKNPKCNFENIIAGTSNYLQCVFKFDSDWNGFIKAAVFYDGKTEFPVLIKNGTCLIPDEVLDKTSIILYIVGKKDNQKIVTNEIEIEQEGGRYGNS